MVELLTKVNNKSINKLCLNFKIYLQAQYCLLLKFTQTLNAIMHQILILHYLCWVCFIYHQKSLMNEFNHFSLYKKFKCSSKEDGNLFDIKYKLSDQYQSPHHHDNKNEKPKSKQSTSKPYQLPAHQKKKLYELKDYSKKVQIKKTEEQIKPSQKLPNVQPLQSTKIKYEEKIYKKDKDIEVAKEEQVKKKQKSQSKYTLVKQFADQEQIDLPKQLVLSHKRSQSAQHKQTWPEVEQTKSKQYGSKRLRILYDDYLDEETIQQSREKGESIYYKGRVQFGEEIKWSCKIISEELEKMLVVEGRHRNRCMHEDEVYFKIIEQTKQKTLCEIVGIVRRQSKQIIGKVQFLQATNLYLLIPINKRIQPMNIHLNEIKQQWLQNFQLKYFLAQFVVWGISDKYPICRIIDYYGQLGQIQIQTKAILNTHGVCDRQYKPEDIKKISAPFVKFIDKNGQYIIPEEEVKSRRDFRKCLTFIVKQNNFDAAYSIRCSQQQDNINTNFLKKKTYQIMVHLVDIAYFVKQNSPLDQQLQKRLVSYNLVHRIIPLLPPTFSDKLCCLGVKKDTLTISVCLHIDEQGNVLDRLEVQKSIITPQVIFNYNQLQLIINKNVQFKQWQQWNCGCKSAEQFQSTAIAMKLLSKIILKSRTKRIESGALPFQIPIKHFKLDQKFSPKQLQIKLKNEASEMIEECIILASSIAGQFVYKNLKEKTILFRHKFPGFRRMGRFKELMKKLGQPLPETNQNQVQKIINESLAKGTIKQCIKDVIKYQTLHLLQGSDYFQVQGSNPASWIHYSVNLPFYAHCSMPTKRYADIIVQRQIISAIEGRGWKKEDQQIKNILQNCNKGKLLSKRVQNDCEKIIMCTYLQNNPIVTTAILTSVESWGIKVCISKYYFKSVITFSHLKTAKVTQFDTDPTFRKYVKLDYCSQNGEVTTKFVLKELQQIHVKILSSNSFPLDYTVILVMPHPNDPQSHILIS